MDRPGGTKIKEWTAQEDNVILAGRQLGLSYSRIASDYFIGRKASSIEYRYLTLTRGRTSYDPSDPPIPPDNQFRRKAEEGSQFLLAALVAYARKHHPTSQLARLEV